jgi:hypothetical protein
MPQRDPGVYLEDIEHYAEAAVRFMTVPSESGGYALWVIARDRTRRDKYRAQQGFFILSCYFSPELLIRRLTFDYVARKKRIP